MIYLSPNAVRKQPPSDYPTFDPHSYLFCAKVQSFGYDYQTLYYNPDLHERSLMYALKPGCKQDPMSLDLVEAGRILHVPVQRPRLEQISHPVVHGQDVFPEAVRRRQPLRAVRAVTARPLRVEVGGRAGQHEDRISDHALVHEGWSDVDTQESTSLRMCNMQTLFEKANRNNSNTETAADVVSSITKFTNTYAKHMEHFMKKRQQFLVQALRASELFTWMCFGITTDEALGGNTILATYYAMANIDSENHCICWTYPLAMIREQWANVVAPPPVLIVDEKYAEALAVDLAL
ncbi:hypothetical protein J6590_093204 [Homalodisca vitripennis]|nr:hypothetical protein J6590_019538 [Homalodisca vitripennis]KAG8275139.1 hypothetical protein J6590_093204 [Homalodisca vitripennis]